MTVALEAAGDLPQKKKKKKRGQQPQDEPGSRKTYGKSKSPKSKIAESSKSSRAKSGRKSIPKGSHKAAKQKRDLERATQQVTSLFTSDVFVDQASIDAADQPTFTSRNKQDALKELIASVPTEDQKTVGSDMRILLAATRDFDGRGAVKTDGNGMWLVKGMKTSLKGYQLLGSAYMRRRENASEEPRGGLMADQMGLGKTLMMLANIVNGRPPKSVTVRTTLIVASPGLLSQWKQEIETHTNANLSVMRYGPGNRLDCSHKFEIFKHFDIILTTYSEIMRSYPKNEPPITMQTAEQKLAWWKVEWQKKRGVLHRMVWHRIVLDEAQMIKNHSSRTSIACRALMAIHRWALSGTPILNSLTELYPYFKFLCVPHTGSFKIFKQNYCGTSNKDSTERLLVRLKSFMIRRTHADTMFGAPILKLPRADQITKYCEFNHIERNIYDIVEARFVEKLNTWSRENELDKSYGNALVMLLRLRQLTAHVLMLQFVMRDLLEREDIERIRQVINEAAAKNPTAQASRTIVAIRKQLIELAEEEKKKGKEDPAIVEPGDPDNASAEDDSGANFGKEFDFKPYLNSLTTGDNWEKVKEKARCKKCDRRPKNPWLTNCSHIYCLQCYEQRFLEAAERETELWTCGCGKTVRFCHPCNPDGELEDSQDSSPRTRSKASKRKVQPGQETVHEDWLSLGGSILPSTKTIAIKAQILNWIEENKDVKVIIYTQFLAMIQILDKACDEEGWQSEQYHGRLSFKAREKAITEFADNSRVRVLLASLRCGGLGLNLTMASRVIVIDPWWNSASEQQAFCRVFRIGQKEETFMTRFCVRNTVDDRLIAMQERKKHEIAKVMEGDNKAKKMTIRDLMRLFGPIQDAEDGRPFILVDNPDPRGGFMADRDHEGYADEM
ncbi:hypothetical protein CC78DRAFT_514734 [Lojkania enalia]|uniref:Uncharacterized protein n=1 Tax=Lojkania enalia TaxID=147567 RepID=A0A9P4KAP4_9PLEO|nr:hypothetical protein CC78DRAFT_514734 [Didymosphaeria enalia]